MSSSADSRTPARLTANDLSDDVARISLSDNNISQTKNNTNMAETTPSDRPATATEQTKEPECLLLKLPGEIRNRVWGHAVSAPGKIIIRREIKETDAELFPPLAKVNKQLEEEVTAALYDVNTFHLESVWSISHWEPFKSCVSRSENSFQHWLHLDLESSIKHHHTLKQYGLQPMKILDEEISLDEMRKFKAGGDSQILASVTVVWATHEKTLLSLVEQPRRKPFLSLYDLEGAGRTRVVEWNEAYDAAKKQDTIDRMLT